MLSFRIGKHETPGQLQQVEIPDPEQGEIQIEIHACALNFADLLMTEGRYQDTPPLPFTPGLECAGIITKLGSDISNFEIGDRVAVFCGQDGLAEYGVFDAAQAVHLPDAVSFDDAAASLIAYGTSLLALQHQARLKAGETLLVTGAAGGVGLTAVEIGKRLGATVIAQARGADKLAVAKAAGADHLIDATDDLRQRVKDLGGADVVYDAVGGDTWTAAFRATNPGGRLIPIGFAGGEVPQIPANHLLVKNLTVIGFYLGGLVKLRPEVGQDTFSTLMTWLAEGQITPHISHRLPLSETARGLELIRTRAATGKVVIQPRAAHPG
ncbi:NADPH:quinone oxidoreductase family protein [Epibacterium sp. Ofav1-8]|uniref:NADPH:quinone oxidoreductase family protein n=1 Tax=Epibacterium sp. Ofav1-8 TaxID=2917735 RepID=UPI001EF56A95|nr:NADPH:quinone oxidoreductase family protein [Epibacterium sp. Ofav1-8]MCG7623057.1 NADPH:quinone oxidoreductase family protein [Epibacterium sp. Ofav1-8]